MSTSIIHFEGDQTFPQAPEQLFPKLSDASFLLSCLQDVDTQTESTPDRAAWKLKPKLSFLSGSLDVWLDIVERKAPEQVRVSIHSKGIGATSTVESLLQFSPHESGTNVHWIGDITSLTGLLKMVPKPLLQATATKIINEVWQSIHEKLIAEAGNGSA